ncbi:hypothetical protein PsYK624_032940 [Phanerochaete sordida]|uniref:Phytocyanin domain-containing protein n=1 Tax=Phanerochaete sordida TaxID=48140 RepID=A0A9P3G2U2_9APHY|nr:hypothetical protein PsYK624_032940 [Phanerochaete sordida]
MVFFAPVLGAAALFAGLASALPRPDSAIGDEVAVSAPNGIVLSDTAALASQMATASASPYYAASATATYAAQMTDSAMTESMMAAGGYYSSSSSSSSWMATQTQAAMGSMMTYGSGSSSWGGQGYNDCVNQCIASYGAPPAMWTPTPSSQGSSGSSGGSGTTHTVIVAPTQGVLRYVPFAVNASVGDTVRFMWGANNHTVTKSSELQLCNKTSDAPFASGTQNQGFTFDQVVNDTNPVFYYCGTPGHCEKGMFGIINPPSVYNAPTSVMNMMPAMVSNSSDLSAMAAYTNNLTMGNMQASMWGQNIDLGQMPDWSHSYVMENVMYARSLFAENPDTLSADGKVDMSAGGNPIKFPMDVTSALNNAGNGSAVNAGAAPSASAPSSDSASPSASTSATPSQMANGAGRSLASGAVVGVAVLAASLLAL